MDKLRLVQDITEGWISSCQLMSEASKRPYVYFHWVMNALSNLWWDPIRGALPGLSPLLLLRKEGGETEVSEFDLPIGGVEDIVWLDISMNHLFPVHS